MIHFYEGNIHKGYIKDCPICSAPKRDRKAAGRKGGQNAARKRAAIGRVGPKCKSCDATVRKDTITGFCMKCLLVEKRRLKAEREAATRLQCCVCGKPISKVSKSGRCSVCVRELPHLQEARRKQSLNFRKLREAKALDRQAPVS